MNGLPSITPQTACRAAAHQALAQVAERAQAALAAEGPEHLHQLRVGMRRLRAALPPAPGQEAEERDQADLQQQAEERCEAGHAAEEAVAHQHADQARTEEAGGETAEHGAGPEEAAGLSSRISCRRPVDCRAGLTGLRHRALDRARRIRRRRGWRRRRECAVAAAAGVKARRGVGQHGEAKRCSDRKQCDCRTKFETSHVRPPKAPGDPGLLSTALYGDYAWPP